MAIVTPRQQSIGSDSHQHGPNLENLSLPPVNGRHGNTSMSFSLLNVHSAVNKPTAISELVRDRSIDLLAITETWPSSVDQSPIVNELCPNGYDNVGWPRDHRTGGGVSLLYRSSIKLKQHKIDRSHAESI